MRNLDPSDYSRMHIPTNFVGARLKNVTESIRGPVERYCRNAPTMIRKGFGFILSGSVGVGKTGAAVVMAKAVKCNGPTVFFVNIGDFREYIKSRAWFDGETTILERCREVDLLVIDALDSELSDDRVAGPVQLARLIETRTQWKKATIVTTRLKLDELRLAHGAMMSVLLERSAFLPVEGPNRRELNERSTHDFLLGTDKSSVPLSSEGPRGPSKISIPDDADDIVPIFSRKPAR